jgi:hypothetical protein
MESIILHSLSPTYISNTVSYLSIFAYITRANFLFQILFPIMITNAIIGTVIIIFYWNNLINKYLNNKDLINDLKNKPYTILAIRILAIILLHWLPIIIYLYLDVLQNNILEPITKWIIGMIFMCIYIIILTRNNMIFENYGYNKKLTYMIILYPIILLIICLVIEKYKTI